MVVSHLCLACHLENGISGPRFSKRPRWVVGISGSTRVVVVIVVGINSHQFQTLIAIYVESVHVKLLAIYYPDGRYLLK